MDALSFKKKAFQKKKGKAVSSKSNEFKEESKTTPIKKSKPSMKRNIEVPATAENSALKVMGLVFSVTDEAIIQWFEENGVKIDQLHRCDTDTWKSGMAYATVSSTDLLQKGVKLNKKELDGRYVNVLIKRRAEMESVLQCVAVLDTIVRLRGLPYNCKTNDIIEFFKGLPIPTHGIYVKSGEAYVRFQDAATAQKALKKNNCYIGQRYVEVFTCKLKQLTDLKYKIINNKNEGHDVMKKFLGGSLEQPPTKKGNLKTPSKMEEEEFVETDEEMQEEVASSEEKDSEISITGVEDEPMKETPPKKQKKSGNMKADLKSKGFAVKAKNSMFTEIAKNSAVKKNSDVAKRTSMVAAKDSEDELVPPLVTVTPKLKGTRKSSNKRLSTGKKGKKRSMFTVTPK